MTDDELKQLIASNAKAIKALSSSQSQECQERQRAYEEWERNRKRLERYMRRMAVAQSAFDQVRADYHHRWSILGDHSDKDRGATNQNRGTAGQAS